MSNISKEHTSTRVHAPPGGHSNNIFGASEFEQSAANKKKNSESNIFGGSEFEQSAANKKKNSESNIFGSKTDNVEPAPAKQTRNPGNNIFGTDAEESHNNAGTLAGQYKQTQMKSNIFGTDEPTSTRAVSDKNKSNIFGIGDNDQNKRQIGAGRRVGYNPINGEAYSTKDNVNEKQPDSTVKAPEGENVSAPAAPTNSAENGNAQVAPTNSAENGNAQAAPAKTNENGNAQKPVEKVDNAANENNPQKNVHTSVRVFHPPGGRSNGPLW